MKTEWRRYAPIGLVIAGLAALFAAGLYIVQRQWNLPLQISLGLVLIGLALFVLLDPERTRQLLTGRQARYGSNALILTIAFIGILVVVNYLAYTNSKRWDLTEDKQFTLAPETVSTLEKLPEAVKAVGFYTARVNSETARSLLDQYAFKSKGKFTYDFVDPEKNPVEAQAAGVTRDGSVVLYMGSTKQLVDNISEAELTGALVRLINPTVRPVYFLQGHGEYSPTEGGERSYSQVKSSLENKNYEVKTLDLLATNQVPADAKVIVVAGPLKPLAQSEVDLLNTYLASGGALIVMEDPTPVTQFGDAPDPLAASLAQNWGINLNNDIVVDLTSQQPFAPYAANYGSHPITDKLQRIASQYPTARSVTVGTPVDGITPVPLVTTADQSWAETNLTGLSNQANPAAYDEGQDTRGPVSLAVAAENTQQKSRVAVFGDADFVADANYTAYANSDVFINTVDWAAGQENLISLTPKQNTQRLMLPPQQSAMNLILLGSVFILPGIVLLAGIVVFVQHRRRG